jgi:hypothetical protein
MTKHDPQHFNLAYEAMVDYILCFCTTRLFRDVARTEHDEYPKQRFAASTGFVDPGMGGDLDAVIGDLVLLTAARQSKWRLSWLHAIELREGGDHIYTVASAIDGELCNWSNVGIQVFNRHTLKHQPHWRWTNQQWKWYHKMWTKAFHESTTLSRCLLAEFDDDKVTVKSCLRYGLSDGTTTRTISWREASVPSMEALAADMEKELLAARKKAPDA